MKSILYDRSLGIRLADLPVPVPGAGDVLIRMLACGVCGTDLLKINKALIHEPTVLGHELVGEVVAIGSGAPFAVGDHLVVAHHVPCYECHYCQRGSVSMCRTFKTTNLDPGGFAEYVRIPARHAHQVARKIPADMSLDEAIFVEPLACCVRNWARLNLAAGDGAVIVGLGSIGVMMALLFQALGVRAIGLDVKPERVTLATRLGVSEAFLSHDNRWQAILKDFPAQAADAVVFTAGDRGLVNQGLAWVRDGGVLNLFCALPERGDFPSTEQLYHREINVVTTYSSSPEALAKSFTLIQTQKISLEGLITHRYPLSDLAQAVVDLNALRALKAVIMGSTLNS